MHIKHTLFVWGGVGLLTTPSFFSSLMIPTLAQSNSDFFSSSPFSPSESQSSSQTSSSQTSSSQTSSQTSSTGSRSVNGRIIRYELYGDRTARANITGDGDAFQVNATVDQTDHTITINPEQIVWNGTPIPISGFNQVEIVIEHEQVAIVVDGQNVFSQK